MIFWIEIAWSFIFSRIPL